MKLSTALGLSICCSLMAIPGFSQVRGICGVMDPTPLLERTVANEKAIAEHPELRSMIAKYVPVTCILVADDNGIGRAREEQVLDALAKVNSYYSDQDMVFYIDEWRYKDNTTIYNTPASSAAIFQMKQIKDPNALNIFVTNTADDGNAESIGTVLGYYWPANDWIVMRKDHFNGLSNTLTHEIGHFFSLAHPHSGWECDPYDPDKHGNPVNILWSPCDASLPVEFQNKSNCQIAGDKICDTNPDYNFGFGWSVGGDQCAPYTPVVMDPNGDTIDVVQNNHMGYFINCDNYMFTPNQKTVIQSDFFSTGRAYIRTGYIPTLTPVDHNVDYVYPVNGEETGTSGTVDLDWDDTPGATDYLVIVDRSSSFSFGPQRFLVSESFLTVEGLVPNSTYYWKIWPFNESQTGAGWAATQHFHTGEASAVESIPSVQQFDIYPNPARVLNDLTVVIGSNSALDVDVDLVDIMGQSIWHQEKNHIDAGRQAHIDVPIGKALPGLYILKVESADGGIMSRKVNLF